MAYRKIPPEEKAARLVDLFLKTAKGDLDKAQTFSSLARLGPRTDERRTRRKRKRIERHSIL